MILFYFRTFSHTSIQNGCRMFDFVPRNVREIDTRPVAFGHGTVCGVGSSGCYGISSYERLTAFVLITQLDGHVDSFAVFNTGYTLVFIVIYSIFTYGQLKWITTLCCCFNKVTINKKYDYFYLNSVSLQFTLGLFTFVVLLCCRTATSACRLRCFAPIHATLGLCTFTLAIATCLTGLQQRADSSIFGHDGFVFYSLSSTHTIFIFIIIL